MMDAMTKKMKPKKKVQTRRSISVSGDLFAALKRYADKNETTLSETVEQQMRQFLAMPPRVKNNYVEKVVPVPVKKAVKAKPVKEVLPEPMPEPEPVKDTVRVCKPVRDIPKTPMREEAVGKTVSDQFTGAANIRFF